MSHIHLHGFLRCVNAEQAELVWTLLPEHIELTRAEHGCLAFFVWPTEDPLTFRVDERFIDEAAYVAHQARLIESAWGVQTQNIPREYTKELVEDPVPYTPDMDWLWEASERRHLLVHVTGGIEKVKEFHHSLKADCNGVRGRGGWAMHLHENAGAPDRITVEFVSGGEDVADAIIDATDSFYTHIKDVPEVELMWEQLGN